MKYRIHWRSKITGATGHGTGLFTKEEAEKIAKQLNETPGGICHHEARPDGSTIEMTLGALVHATILEPEPKKIP